MKKMMSFALGAAAACAPAAAQCSMCRNAVAAQGAADTFDRAILILLVPAVVMFSSVFIFACRCGSSDRADDAKPPEGWHEGTVD